MKIWIVTPSFNQAHFLAQTLQCVLGQQGPFELRCIVVDGGSTDGTLGLLRSINDGRLTWTSGKDAGQSDAINRGLAHAGTSADDVVTWLNSDDLYTPGTLAAVVEAFGSAPAPGGRGRWLIGRCEVIDAAGKVIRQGVTRYKDRSLRRYSRRALLRENFISQMSVFWRGDFGREVGPLDTALHYTMDYDLWLRMASRSEPLILDRVLGQFRLHSQSKSGRVSREQFDEQFRVAQRYFGDDRTSRWVHRFNVEKIVWAYRVMRLIGR